MIRPVRTEGDPVLRRKSRKVERIEPSILHLLDDMAETMYAAPGIGLAAPQVGINLRVIVVDVGEGLYKLVNPKITQKEGCEVVTEGCLSVPGKVGDVERSEKIVVKAMLPDGKHTRIEAEGIFAICLQHEIDHLDGILYVDKAENLREAGADDEDFDEEDEDEVFDEETETAGQDPQGEKVSPDGEDGNYGIIAGSTGKKGDISPGAHIPGLIISNDRPAIFEVQQ